MLTVAILVATFAVAFAAFAPKRPVYSGPLQFPGSFAADYFRRTGRPLFGEDE